MQYVYGKTTFKLGRQELKTPLEDMDDARMLPNLFEGVVVTNTDIPDTQIIINHMWSMAYGTFANAYTQAARWPYSRVMDMIGITASQ